MLSLESFAYFSLKFIYIAFLLEALVRHTIGKLGSVSGHLLLIQAFLKLKYPSCWLVETQRFTRERSLLQLHLLSSVFAAQLYRYVIHIFGSNKTYRLIKCLFSLNILYNIYYMNHALPTKIFKQN